MLNEKARIRKLDNNNKFNIGGLVIKAKLDDLYHKDKAILLGAFLYIKMMLESDNADNYIETFKELGQAVFDKDLQRKAALKELKKNA